MNLLLIGDFFPTPDRNSADFRLMRLIGMLQAGHQVFYCAPGEQRQAIKFGAEVTARYRAELAASGVQVVDGGVLAALRARRYDAVVFEWHFPAVAFIDAVRQLQPAARVLVDSVDVVFHRLQAGKCHSKTTAS